MTDVTPPAAPAAAPATTMDPALADALGDENASWLAERARADGRAELDWLADLVTRERKIAHLRELVREGLESGISDKTIDDVWTEARARASQ